MASSIVPSVSTPAMDSDRTGSFRERISSFRKGGMPLAQVMTIRVWRMKEEVTPLLNPPVKYREKRLRGQRQRGISEQFSP